MKKQTGKRSAWSKFWDFFSGISKDNQKPAFSFDLTEEGDPFGPPSSVAGALFDGYIFRAFPY